MSESKHTSGPVHRKECFCWLLQDNEHLNRASFLVQPSFDAQGTVTPKDEVEQTACLLAAAYNSYDKHCGPRAIGRAENDLLGEALEGCRKALTCSSIDSNVRSLLKEILAKVKGEKP